MLSATVMPAAAPRAAQTSATVMPGRRAMAASSALPKAVGRAVGQHGHELDVEQVAFLHGQRQATGRAYVYAQDEGMSGFQASVGASRGQNRRDGRMRRGSERGPLRARGRKDDGAESDDRPQDQA